MGRTMDIGILPCLAIGLLAAAMAGCAGRGTPPHRILPEQAGPWSAPEPPELYDAESIYSYIDGHAEVYLAYGMQSCVSRRYSGPEGEPDIVADLFRMATTDDAFGVFTVDLDGEDAAVGLDGLYRHGWLSFWKGRYFVSVYAEEETDASEAAVYELGHAIAARIDSDARHPPVIDSLPRDGLERRSVRFLRTEQVLRMHLYLGEDEVAGLGGDTGAALGKYLRRGVSAHLLVVEYPNEQRARAAQDEFTARFLGGGSEDDVNEDAAGRWYGSRRAGPRAAYVLGAGDDELARDLLREAMVEDRDEP